MSTEKTSKISFATISSICAIAVSIGSILFGALQSQTKLEYLTKEEFNKSKIEQVQIITEMRKDLGNGFYNVGQDLKNLQFVTLKEFVDHKEKESDTHNSQSMQIAYLKKDILAIEKTLEENKRQAMILESQVGFLKESLSKIQQK